MPRQKRNPVLLDPSYPPERRLLDAIKSVPEGDRAAFLRALALLGDQEISKEEQQPANPSPPERTDADGT